jgi:Mrp family chromosome partitioning ATPase
MTRLRAAGDANRASTRRRFEDDIEALRLRITAAAQASGGPILSLLGPNPGVGTTTLAVALARSLTRESRRTLLVDGNFVNPMIHDLFETSGQPGAVDLLNGRATPSEVVRPTADPNLSVLPYGRHEGSTISTSVEHWRSQLRQLAPGRFILIDAGSADSPNSLTMADASDGVILVVKSGESRLEQIESIKRRMAASGTKLLGVVLNQRRHLVPAAIYRRL